MRSNLGTLTRKAALTATLILGAASMQGCAAGGFIAAVGLAGSGVVIPMALDATACDLQRDLLQETRLSREELPEGRVRYLEGTVIEEGRDTVSVKTPRGKLIRTDERYWVTLRSPKGGTGMVPFGTTYKFIPWKEQRCSDPSYLITPISAEEADRRINVGDYVRLRVHSQAMEFDPVLEIISVKKTTGKQ